MSMTSSANGIPTVTASQITSQTEESCVVKVYTTDPAYSSKVSAAAVSAGSTGGNGGSGGVTGTTSAVVASATGSSGAARVVNGAKMAVGCSVLLVGVLLGVGC